MSLLMLPNRSCLISLSYQGICSVQFPPALQVMYLITSHPVHSESKGLTIRDQLQVQQIADMHTSTYSLILLALTTTSKALNIRGAMDRPWIGEFKSETCDGGPVTNATLWDASDADTPGYTGDPDMRPEIRGNDCVIWMPSLPNDEAKAIGISFGTGKRRDSGFDIYIGSMNHQCDTESYVGTVFANATATKDLATTKVQKLGPGVCLVIDDTLEDMTMIKKH